MTKLDEYTVRSLVVDVAGTIVEERVSVVVGFVSCVTVIQPVRKIPPPRIEVGNDMLNPPKLAWKFVPEPSGGRHK